MMLYLVNKLEVDVDIVVQQAKLVLRKPWSVWGTCARKCQDLREGSQGDHGVVVHAPSCWGTGYNSGCNCSDACTDVKMGRSAKGKQEVPSWCDVHWTSC